MKYHNVMELLVDQEVERQLDELPVKLVRYINRAEVATYALNRLPPLYASSAEAWRNQKLRGEKKLKHHITAAVRQAFVAIQRDPIRGSTPLKRAEKAEEQTAQMALQELRDLLQDQALSWQNLLRAVEQALGKTAQLMRCGDMGIHGRRETPCFGAQQDAVASNIGDSSEEVLGIQHKALSSQMSFSCSCLKTGVSDHIDADLTGVRRRVSPSGRPSVVKVTQDLSAHLSESNDD